MIKYKGDDEIVNETLSSHSFEEFKSNYNYIIEKLND